VDRIRDVFAFIFFLKLNRIEAELLCQFEIKENSQIVQAAEYLHQKGVAVVCISLGDQGLYYSSAKDSDRKRFSKKGSVNLWPSNQDISGEFVKASQVDVVNTNGAGDAMTAGMIYGYLKKESLKRSVFFGQACAALTVQNEATVSDELTEEKIIKFTERHYK